jgi:hypothetical protein
MPYAAAHYQELQPQQLFDCRLVSEHIESLFQNTLKRLDVHQITWKRNSRSRCPNEGDLILHRGESFWCSL